MSTVYIVERSKDGGVTWKPMYEVKQYVRQALADHKAKLMNDETAKYASKFRAWKFRAVAYSRVE